MKTASTANAATRSARLFQSLAFLSVVAAHPTGGSAFLVPKGTKATAVTGGVGLQSWRRLGHGPTASASAASSHSVAQISSSSLHQRRFMMSGGNSESSNSKTGPGQIQHVNRHQMEEIVEVFHEDGRKDSGYCIIEVRTDQEVMMTGKLADSIPTVPLQVILQSNVFALDPDEFEEICGFAKPDLDETLVFTCAAGVRSVYACQVAATAGYSKLVNYVGGANEWFSPPRSQF